MGSDVNEVLLLGNVGRDPEIRSFQNGNQIATFSLATNREWKDKHTGERKSVVTWHNIVVQDKNLIDVVKKYVKKGSRLLLCGGLEVRKYTDKNGIERTVSEIVIRPYGSMLKLQDRGGGRGAAAASASDSAPDPTDMEAIDLDDEIPF